MAYLSADYPYDVSALATIDVSVTMTKDSGTTYVYDGPAPGNPCDVAPSAHLLLVRHPDALGPGDPRWWWRGGSIPLGAGDITLSADLTDLSQWSDVNGLTADSSPAATARFHDVLRWLGTVGLTFGGGCFYGHGAWIDTGSARFTVTDFSVN